VQSKRRPIAAPCRHRLLAPLRRCVAETSSLRIAAMPPKPVAGLRRRIIEHARQLRTAFEAAPDEARGAMRTLLGERRMR